jgi:glutamine synthetase
MNVHRNALSDEAGASRFGAAEVAAFLSENPNVQYVDCVFVDLCGNVRGKRIACGELDELFRNGLSVPGSIYFLDARGDVIDAQAANAGASGTAWPVAGTLTRVSWAQRPHGQVLMALRDSKGEPYFGEPRNVLRRVVKRFDEFDVAPAVGIEIDAFIVDRERGKNGLPQETTAADGAVLELIRKDIAGAAEAQALPQLSIEGSSPRIHIGFAVQNDAVAAADHVVFLRQVVRAVARNHKRDALFMARPFLTRAGSSMRVMVDVKRAGESVFSSDSGRDLARFAAGGLQALMAESIALFAPSVNAFRRFSGETTAPRNKRWGYSNASANVSVVVGGDAEPRLEHRVAGADANPYLAIAAVLAGIHHGIGQNIDPGQSSDGDVAALVDPTLPLNIDGALLTLENGSVMREYLGPTYVDLYCATKRTELERFRDFIPAHEYDWYA